MLWIFFFHEHFHALNHLPSATYSSICSSLFLVFQKVFLAEHKITKEVYAIKSLKKDLIVKEDDVECILNERHVLSLQKKPPFLTGLHSSFQTKEHLFLVMDYVCGGDLMFHILELGRFSECETK